MLIMMNDLYEVTYVDIAAISAEVRKSIYCFWFEHFVLSVPP